MPYPIKMTILVPRYLQMTPGKVAAQVGHAVQMATEWATRHDREVWGTYRGAPVKITLGVDSEAELYEVMAAAAHAKIPVHPFMDMPPTTQGTEYKITAVALGPVRSSKMDKITKHLTFY